MKSALILDTNILINFLEEENINDYKTYFSLKFLNIHNCIDVFLVDTVVTEWNTLKHKKVDNIEKSLNDKFKTFQKFLGTEEVKEFDSTLSNNSLDLIERYKNKCLTLSKTRIREIDDMIQNNFKIIPHNNTIVMKLLGQMSYNYDEPFFVKEMKNQKGKMEIEDATIFLSSTMHFSNITRNKYTHVYFITENTKDFCINNDPNKLHPNIKSRFDENKIDFSPKLKPILDRILTEQQQLDQLIDFIADSNKNSIKHMANEHFEICPKCSNKTHKNIDAITYYDKYYLKCSKCYHEWPTADYIHD
ncbi:hypothetical protein [Staphylococcus saprophyticus]|uniref:hypothetical protein n=1 Tax=Staphylococcaceae TaxID=90964 RepID=UPI0011A585E3|nr:hypothetical protein [Staphylococcus saprophyticus]MDW3865553.1 hypothetical protein [Staphylococcus saprophyticus]